MTLVRTVMMNKKLHCSSDPSIGSWEVGKVKIGFRGVTPVKRVETAKSAKRADRTSGPSYSIPVVLTEIHSLKILRTIHHGLLIRFK